MTEDQVNLEVKRALEWDADGSAAVRSLWLAIAGPSLFERECGVTMSQYERTKMWAMAQYVIFRLQFAHERPSTPDEWREMLFKTDVSHPPPPFRMHLIMTSVAEDAMNHRFGTMISESELIHANIDAIFEIERGLTLLTGQYFDVEWFHQITSMLSEGAAAVDRFNEDWASIHDRLKRFAREPIQPPNPDAQKRLAARLGKSSESINSRPGRRRRS